MRILFVTEEPIRFSGTMVRGGQIHVRNVFRGLQERGHDVRLVDWNSSPDNSFQHSVAPKCRFFDGPIRTLYRILEVGRTFDPDVVVSKTRKVYLPGLTASQILGVPHVVHVGSSLDPPVNGVIDRLDAKSFTGRLRAPHDAYFVVCSAIGDELRQRRISSNQIYNVRNAVDESRFVPDPEVELPQPARNRIENAPRPILGFVGGINDYKGVFDLAEAVKRMNVGPSILVAGEGPDRDRFECALGKQGFFLGSIDYERMPAVYAAMDALVLPSHTEGLPRVLLEAGAAGVPVVATSVGGVPGIVEDGDTGLLCPPQNPEELAATVDELFTNRDPVRMGNKGRELIAHEYTWEALYDRYESYLKEITSR